jgi:hypothetical protein
MAQHEAWYFENEISRTESEAGKVSFAGGSIAAIGESSSWLICILFGEKFHGYVYSSTERNG